MNSEALQKKRAYDKEYIKKYYKGKCVMFNTQFPEDIALLDWIKAQPEEGTKYIKRLIREDMEKHQNV